MKDVLLMSPATRAFNHYRPPLALMYLSGYLKRHGVGAKIIDVIQTHQIRDKHFGENMARYHQEVEDETLSRISQANADIVGITCYTPELDEVEKFAARIKVIKPGMTIIVGGVHPTLYPEHFVYPSSPFDFAVIGEGEVTLLDLVQNIRAGVTDFSSIQGIAFLDTGTGRMVVNPRRPLAENLDEIAFPDFADLDMDYYTSASPYAIRGVFTRSFYVSSSRGCPSSCTFCVSKKLRDYHGVRHYARLRSPDSLIREISELRQRYAIDSFYFIDDLFTMRKENVKQFCERLKTAALGLVWGCSSKVNTVDYETLRLMREAGCLQIDFGVEKGSDEALAKIKKGISVAQIKQTFQWCRELGIRTFANMLVNTPGEQAGDLDDIVRLLNEIKPTVVSANIFTPYPGCQIFDERGALISRADYPLLMKDSAELMRTLPAKFKFCDHAVDLRGWVNGVMRNFNRVGPNLRTFFDRQYVGSILRSKRKSNYIKQLWLLIREFINQKA